MQTTYSKAFEDELRGIYFTPGVYQPNTLLVDHIPATHVVCRRQQLFWLLLLGTMLSRGKFIVQKHQHSKYQFHSSPISR